MATYALTYATRAAFDTALASGNIYSLMQGVTSSQPSVAIAAHITESGETFSCGTNVMIDIKSVGPGDRIIYDSTNAKFFGIASKWIDNNYPSQPTQHIMIFKTGVLPARFVDCGVCVKRFGNRIRIAGESANVAWAGGNWLVSALPTYYEVVKKSRTTTTPYNGNAWCAFPSLRYQEAKYASSGHSSYLPIRRISWNAAVTSGAETVTENGKTATLADYDYSYDKWLAINFSPLFPSSVGVYASNNGIGDTQKIVADFVANHGKTAASVDYSAGYCYNYSKAAPGLGSHQWFLGTVKDLGEVRALTHTLPIPIAWDTAYLSTCNQFSYRFAWYINYNGMTDYRNANDTLNGYYSVPLADLILEN